MMPTKIDIPNELYMAIGRCIIEWNAVETNLYIVLTMLLNENKRDASNLLNEELGSIYYTALSFEHKVKILDNLAYLRFNETHLERWRKLKNKLIAQSKIRNRIAHYQTARNGDSYFIAPQMFNIVAKIKNLPTYDIKTLQAKAENFRELGADVVKFAFYAGAVKKSLASKYFPNPLD